MAKISEKTFDAFHVSSQDRARARELEREMETKYEVDPTQLKGMEKMVGIRAADIKRMMGKTVHV